MEQTDNANSAVQAVQSLVAHVDAQERRRQITKDAGGKYVPTEDEKTERDRLLRQVLAALGCTRAELLTRLNVDRATWDRWRGMTTLPQRMHLEALTRFATRFATEKNKDAYAESISKPRPLNMLSVDPEERTWGRLRLVYSFFPWENAIFCFKHTFSDPDTVTEIALLTLREEGCDVIYMLSEPTEWGPGYIASLKSVLGENDTARVLSRICIIKVPQSIMAEMPEEGFGLFNYEAGDPDMRVGYRWLLTESTRPKDDTPQVYDPLSANSKQFSRLKQRFGAVLSSALQTIADRQLPDFWESSLSDETITRLLRIPVVALDSEEIDYVLPD